MGAVGKTCVVELRRASNGAYYGAFTVGDGVLVARSRAFDRDDPAADAEARASLEFALKTLGWRPAAGGDRRQRAGSVWQQ
jgi:hypothetical protein